MKRSIAICSVLCLSLAACAGWSKKKCESTNWQQLGYSEGSSGRPNSSASYSNTCSKKGANIDVQGYNAGHSKGLAVFCSFEAGKGVGVNNGALNPTCQRFDNYMQGYSAGMKVFCSGDNGYDTAIEGKDPVNTCLKYKVYAAAYKKGQRDFCTEKNGFRLGEKGMPFPEKCERSGRAFERAFNKGRLGYLEDTLKEKTASLISARRDYERTRDDLQDMQFELGRMPRYSTDDVIISRKRSLESQIARTRDERDRMREEVDGMDRDLNEIRREISYLRKRI